MRIIKTDDPDVDIITNDHTDFDILSVNEQIEYIETENALFFSERQKRGELKQIIEKKRKGLKLFRKIAVMLGLL